MTPNRRIFLNIVATYGRSLYALVVGLFCGRWTLMSSGTAARGRIDLVNQKVYNTPHQMTARTDRSDPGRYSPAYATGRERIMGLRRWAFRTVSLESVAWGNYS